jgi:cell division protein FtsN
MGWFELADQTFDRVRRQYASAAGGVPATRAGQAIGARAFFVQVATYSNQASADRELATLKKQGVDGIRQSDVANSKYYVRIGPIPTYTDAKTLQARMTGGYADAFILP